MERTCDQNRNSYSYEESIRMLKEIDFGSMNSWEWDKTKNKLILQDENSRTLFQLPTAFPFPKHDEKISEYIERIPQKAGSFLIVLIQAGHSAFGVWDNGEFVLHKVIKKYMVRGNGKAQIGYLKTRGKSKAGSRVRLANTVSFFEDINEKIREWNVIESVSRIIWSCPVNLRSLWYESRITPPFEKEDERLIKLPFGTGTPDFEEMKRISRKVLRGYLEIEKFNGKC